MFAVAKGKICILTFLKHIANEKDVQHETR